MENGDVSMENPFATPKKGNVSRKNAIVSLENRTVKANYQFVIYYKPLKIKLWHQGPNLPTHQP
ncbi:hypothetical protein SD074_07240 [Prolixibacter sp. SD074]|nr:hypothetical protein SD074_07240 [Prolixibacter sp. SD074]